MVISTGMAMVIETVIAFVMPKLLRDAGGEPLPDPLAGRLHRPRAQPARQGRRSGVPLHQLWGGEGGDEDGDAADVDEDGDDDADDDDGDDDEGCGDDDGDGEQDELVMAVTRVKCGDEDGDAAGVDEDGDGDEDLFAMAMEMAILITSMSASMSMSMIMHIQDEHEHGDNPQNCFVHVGPSQPLTQKKGRRLAILLQSRNLSVHCI